LVALAFWLAQVLGFLAQAQGLLVWVLVLARWRKAMT
jgi:hypothetical protein